MGAAQITPILANSDVVNLVAFSDSCRGGVVTPCLFFSSTKFWILSPFLIHCWSSQVSTTDGDDDDDNDDDDAPPFPSIDFAVNFSE